MGRAANPTEMAGPVSPGRQIQQGQWSAREPEIGRGRQRLGGDIGGRES